MPDDATLFVIFHGSWSFLDTPNYIYVKTPEMGDDHVYRAGNWLAEHQLPQGSYYRLTDAVGGTPDCCVDPRLHPVLRGAGIAGTREGRGSHTTLLLAKPLKWHQLCPAIIPAGELTVNDDATKILSQDGSGGVHDPKNYPTTVSFYNVLEYSFNTHWAPTIQGMDWWVANAIPDYKGRGKAATLHFFAEHETGLSDAAHFGDAFHYGSLILGGNLSVTVGELDMGPLCPPPLLDRRLFEFLTLSSRTDVLGNIGSGLATLDSDGIPTKDYLDSYWNDAVKGLKKGVKDLPAATCLPNAGDGSCP